jgi:phosphoribosyl-ATP pyrophosphohydrolase
VTVELDDFRMRDEAVGTEPKGVARAAKSRDRLTALALAVAGHTGKPTGHSRTAKLINGGTPKMAQKLVEEAAEVAIEAMRGDRTGIIAEAADLVYNLTVLLTASGIPVEELWREMDRREALLGLAEKLPKQREREG